MGKVGKSLECLINLLGKLTGRGYDKRCGMRYFILRNVMEKRKKIGCSFSGTGLCAGNKITAIHNNWNNLFLDRGWDIEAHGFKTLI